MWFKYCFLLIFALSACEEIYTPKIESRENVLVADARIVAGKNDNVIKLYESKGFYDQSFNYPNVSGAEVSIIDSYGGETALDETSEGIFPVEIDLYPELQYKLKITFGGNTYESAFEPVPNIPDLDTVYGVPGIKYVKQGGNNDVEDIIEIQGVQLYTNITHEKLMPFYKFTSRKILQYIYPVEVSFMGEVIIEPMYAWLTVYPKELYNIASPPGFSTSTNIVKHPLFFMNQKLTPELGQYFAGWILILYQYGISESAYKYYDDLNKQMGSEGSLFDPMYVQARNNLKCINNPKQIILGNFEISAVKEHRYFVNYISKELGYLIKPIPYFYEIPTSGEQISTPPDFWEYETKPYPKE